MCDIILHFGLILNDNIAKCRKETERNRKRQKDLERFFTGNSPSKLRMSLDQMILIWLCIHFVRSYATKSWFQRLIHLIESKLPTQNHLMRAFFPPSSAILLDALDINVFILEKKNLKGLHVDFAKKTKKQEDYFTEIWVH